MSLPTPAAHERTHTPRRVDHGAQLANQIEALLPTPTARDGKAGMDHRERVEGADLYQVAAKLLPTPTAQDGNGSRNSTATVRPDSTGNVGDTLTDAAWLLEGIGDRLRGRSPDGKPSWEDQPLPLWPDGN